MEHQKEGTPKQSEVNEQRQKERRECRENGTENERERWRTSQTQHRVSTGIGWERSPDYRNKGMDAWEIAQELLS